jgi:hypothetical protein
MFRHLHYCCTLLPWLLLAPGLAPQSQAAEVELIHHARTGLTGYKVVEDGFGLEFIPLHKDFVRAVYLGRGLPAEIGDGVARYCVFGTIARNESDGPLSYRVSEWRYITPDGARHPVKTKSQWVSEWRDRGLAFMWTLLPDAQDFAVGDWNQGFTTIDLPPGSRFDLFYTWHLDGEPHSAVIEGMQCAPEVLPNAASNS